MSKDATNIEFDDLHARYQMVPQGYEGLTWKNADYALASNFDFIYGTSGFDHGLVSPFNVSFNHDDTKPYEVSDPIGTFDLDSVYLTSATYVGERVTVKGFLDGELLYKKTVTVSDDAATRFNFHFDGVDRLTIIGSGGTHDDTVKGDTHQVVIDNLKLTLHDDDTTPSTAVGHEPFQGLSLADHALWQHAGLMLA